MASPSLSLSLLLSQSLRVSPTGAAGQARLGERLVAVGDGGVDRAGGWTRTSRDRYVRACRPRSTSRHVPGSSRRPHLRAAGSNNHMRETIYVGTLVLAFEDWWLSPPPPLPRNFARTERSKGGMGWREVARPRTRCLSRLRLGGQAALAGEEGRARGHVRRGSGRRSRVLLLPLRAQAGPGRPRGTTIQLFLTATRPAAISSASTSSSTMCTRLPADRTHAHRGAWGHTRADHLSPPPAEAARPPPSAMSQPDGQRREPLILEEEHELDRDHREQLASRDRRLCARGCSCAPAAARAVGCCCDISRHTR
jgi:hypothetical protein